jgi:CheY-like chemotaxis protein
MPVLNGWDFLKKYTETYKSHFPDCKIIILTSSINPGDRQQANQNEFVVDFLVKPVSMTGLDALKQNSYLKAYFPEV